MTHIDTLAYTIDSRSVLQPCHNIIITSYLARHLPL